MGAGSPNWAELERLDRLPKNMRHMVPGAAERGELKDRIVELEGKLRLAISLMTPEQKAEFKEKLKEPEKTE